MSREGRFSELSALHWKGIGIALKSRCLSNAKPMPFQCNAEGAPFGVFAVGCGSENISSHFFAFEMKGNEKYLVFLHVVLL